ncbi:FecR domain-containing protein [Candidatus Sumerlaeota bacterium]|nr:FecR domain-containing protein [Candidatus Sumerlaeota bacterium]
MKESVNIEKLLRAEPMSDAEWAALRREMDEDEAQEYMQFHREACALRELSEAKLEQAAPEARRIAGYALETIRRDPEMGGAVDEAPSFAERFRRDWLHALRQEAQVVLQMMLSGAHLLPAPQNDEREAAEDDFEPHGWASWQALAFYVTAVLLVVTILLPGRRTEESEQTAAAQSGEVTDATGEILIISEDCSKVVDVEPSVRVALAEGASISDTPGNQIKYLSGDIWIDVEKGKAGFMVVTDYGKAQVLGTSFGFKPDGEDHLILQVSEGTVYFTHPNEEHLVTKGMALRIGREGCLAFDDESAVSPQWVASAYRDESINKIPDLLAWWDMEPEALNNNRRSLVPDRGPFGLYGITAGDGKVKFGVPSANTELFGSAAEFSYEEKSFIRIYRPEPLNQLKDNYTVMAWIHPRQPKGENESERWLRILACSTIQCGFRFGLRPGGTLDFYPGADVHHFALTDADLELYSSWNHVAVTCARGGKEIKFYLNGKLAAQRSVACEPPRPMPVDWFIGRNRTDDITPPIIDNYFDGAIDEVRIYGRALSESEIITIGKIDLMRR